MVDYMLSVWPAGSVPADGGAPIRLCVVGESKAVAEHSSGFDMSSLHHGGKEIDLETCLSATEMLDTAAVDAIGDQLWTRLAPGEIDSAIRPLVGQDRIYLHLAAPGLLRYPWELTRLDNQFVFAANRTRWCIGQPEPSTHFDRGDAPPVGHPLRVLVVIANEPSDDYGIRAEEELRVIERAAHQHNAEVLFSVLIRPASPDIEARLRDFRPHVLHLIAHGSLDPHGAPRVRIHSATTGTNELWDAARIRTVIAQAPPRLVVLNACLTAADTVEATSLAGAFTDAGCLAVIGMLGEITGAASEAFSARFYREVFDGQPVDRAASRARGAMRTADGANATQRANWPLPRLVVRGDAETAVVMSHRDAPATAGRHTPDFVARWDERWRAWQAVDGVLKGVDGRESRLLVVHGRADAGKRELLNLLADARERSGESVLMVDLPTDRTGGWRDVLRAIAERAAADGFDADALLAVLADQDAGSGTVTKRFRAELEHLVRRGDDRGTPLLVVLDGLSAWSTDLVAQTVLPELCWPYLHADPTSRVRMMVSLLDRVDDRAWGPRPAAWNAIHIGQFDAGEWARALRQFESYWVAQIPPDKQAGFCAMARAMAADPSAAVLDYLRGYARRIA